MEQQLLAFITALRKRDLPVSTAETLDAMQAAAAVGYEQRQILHGALAATLAKDPSHKPVFDECFELFFSSPEALKQKAQQAQGEEEQEEAEEQSEANQNNTGNEGSEGETGDGGVGGDSADGQVQAIIGEALSQQAGSNSQGGYGESSSAMQLREAAEDVQLQNMQYSTQRGLFQRRLRERMNVQALDEAVAALEAIESEAAVEGAEWLRQRREQLLDSIREAVDHQLLLNADAAGRNIQENALRNTRLSALEQHHMRMLPELIRKLANKLVTRHKRRTHRRNSGRLNMGKTLRRNIAYGGVPFHLYWKQTKPDQARIIVLCDVSGSVSTYARFLLLFLYSLNDVLPHIRSFVFCHRMHEVSDLFDREPAEKAVEIANQRYGQGGSDYGSAFADFAQQAMDSIDRNTTVLILGDGRTGGGYSGLEILKQVYQRSNLVLWFNPEPKAMWNTGDSAIKRYQTASHYVAECNSLAKLERLLDDLLRLLR